MGRKHKSFSKDDTTQKLKQKVRRLESDKRKLLSDLKTLQSAFDRSSEFISKKTKTIAVEHIVKQSAETLQELEDSWECPECGSFDFSKVGHPSGNYMWKICKSCKHKEKIDLQSE